MVSTEEEQDVDVRRAIVYRKFILIQSTWLWNFWNWLWCSVIVVHLIVVHLHLCLWGIDNIVGEVFEVG